METVVAFGAIDEAMSLYQGEETSNEEAVAFLLADLKAWCAERGVPFDDALAEASKMMAA